MTFEYGKVKSFKINYLAVLSYYDKYIYHINIGLYDNNGSLKYNNRYKWSPIKLSFTKLSLHYHFNTLINCAEFIKCNGDNIKHLDITIVNSINDHKRQTKMLNILKRIKVIYLLNIIKQFPQLEKVCILGNFKYKYKISNYFFNEYSKNFKNIYLVIKHFDPNINTLILKDLKQFSNTNIYFNFTNECQICGYQEYMNYAKILPPCCNYIE